MSGVTNTLNELFEAHRLVFWYDPEGGMREEFEGYPLGNGEKVEVNNNEFGLKYRMAREEPNTSFLIYLPYPRPSHADNWFLDLELANHVFNADETSLILQEMGWLEEHRPFVEEFASFFKSKDRKEKLLERLHPEDKERNWKLKMAGVLAKEIPPSTISFLHCWQSLSMESKRGGKRSKNLACKNSFGTRWLVLMIIARKNPAYWTFLSKPSLPLLHVERIPNWEEMLSY